MFSPSPARPLLLLVVQILSFLAMTVCFGLTWLKWNGSISSLRGCGGEGGCSQVMGGRWSEWFYTPVTLWAGLVYLGVALLTLRRVQQSLGRTGDQLLAAGGVVLAGAAVYFLSLMFFDEKDGGFCPWCLGLHLTGLTVSGIILFLTMQRRREGGQGVLEAAVLTGVAALGILSAGQVWGPRPETHLLTKSGLKEIGASAPAPASGGQTSGQPQAPRTVTFFGGAMTYDAADLPLLGVPDARVVLVEYFDYTCRSCREMAGDLKQLQKKWPGHFSVIVLPAPLNRACNPFLRNDVKDHPGACELARLALALWRVKPGAFPEFHDYLMSLPLPVSAAAVESARQKAGELAGGPAVAEALEHEWVSNRLIENISNFAKLTSESIVMPKLLLHTQVMMHGPAKDTKTFIAVMEQQFQLPGAGVQINSPPK